MTDLYLRATNEAAAVLAMPWARGTDDNGQPRWLTSGPGWVLCAGVLATRNTGTVDANGNPITALATGFHINIRLTDPNMEAVVAATGLVIAPVTPTQVWATE